MEEDAVARAVAGAGDDGGLETIEHNVARFVRILRRLGVRVSGAETVDAVCALSRVNLLDRGHVRAALSACLAKSRQEAAVFEQAFALFFTTPEAKAGQRERYREREERNGRLRDAAQGELREAVGRWGRDLSVTGEQLRTFAMLPQQARDRLKDVLRRVKANGVNDAGHLVSMILQSSLNYWRYHMMKNKVDRGEDLSGIEAELTGDAESDEVIRGVAAAFYRHPEDRILHRDLEGLEEADLPRVTALIGRLAARLDLSLGRRYQRSSRAQAVDIRRTVRRNIQYGGLPLELRYRARRRKKPHFVLICDVSASMARHARFVLQFIYGLGSGLGNSESFVFSEDLERTTDYFRHHRDFARCMTEVVNGSRQWGKTTNLYESLRTFRRLYRDAVTRDTVVFVVSDGKTVAPEAAAALLGEMGRRSRGLVWLNTSPRREWDKNPAVRILGAVVDMHECNTLARLEECFRRHLAPRV